MEKKIYSAKDIAQWFINRSKFDGEFIDKIKLEKLLFFTQGLHITLKSAPLFEDDFTSFDNGPIIKKVFPLYAKIIGKKIDSLKSVDVDIDTTEFLEKVYNVFGQYATWKLVEMSHNQKCYIDTIKNLIISKDSIAKHFKEDNEKYIEEFNKLDIDDDIIERSYFLNKHYKAFKALAK